MTSSRQTDVSLVIKARDEAQGAVKAITNALLGLGKAQESTADGAENLSGRLQSVIATAATLDRAYGQVSSAVDTGSEAFVRQAAKLAENQTQLAALKRQLEAAQKAAAGFNEFIGPRAPTETARYSAITAEVKNLDGQIRVLSRSVESQSTGFKKSSSDLQEIGRALRLVGAAETFAKQQTDEHTASLEAQIAQTERATNAVAQNAVALRAIGASQYQDSGKSAESSADVFMRAGLTGSEKQIAAELEHTKAIDRSNAALVEQGRLEVALSKLDSSTGKKARDSASAFQAGGLNELEQELEAVAAKERAVAEAEQEAAVQMQAQRDAAVRLREALDPLRVVQDKLNRELEEVNKLRKAQIITAEELIAAEKLLKDNADRAAQALGKQTVGGSAAPFGLRPHELQNLSYQVNDIATQLASGTSLAQTLGQQGGQILQIFPKVGSAIAGAFKNPYAVTLAAVIGTIVLGLKEAGDQAERVRTFLAQLALSADGASYGAGALNDTAEALDRYGLSATDAVKVVKIAMREGFDPAQIEKFGRAAQDLADVMGIDVVEAAQKLGNGFDGSFESLDKLDKETNAFTASQREAIKSLFDQGKSQDAVSKAMDIMSGKLDDAATKARGPWSDSTREMAAAWSEFLNYISQTDIVEGMSGALEGMAKSAAKAFREARGARTLADIKDDLKQVNDLIDADRKKGGNSTNLASMKADLETELKALETLTAANARRADPAVRLKNSQEQAKADQRVTEEMDKQAAAAKKVRSEADITAKLAQTRRDALAEVGRSSPGASDTAKGKFADSAVASERVKLEKELADYRKQQAASAKEAANADERSLKAYVARVVKTESGGNTNAKNTESTATGVGQFLEKTWLDLFRKNFPEQAATMGRDAILALRRDATISKSLIESYARENAARLKTASVSVTEANLYLAHFLGPNGAVKVLKAAADKPISAILGADAIAANKKVLGGGATAGSVRKYAQTRFPSSDAGSPEQARLEGEARLADLDQQRADAQAKFNEGVDQENTKRSETTAALKAQESLIGEALIAEQRKQAVADSVAEKQREIDRLNVDRVAKGQEELTLTQAQKDAIAATTGAYFDLAHAKDVAAAKRDAVDNPVSDFTAQRDAIQQQIQFLRDNGNQAEANQLQPLLDGVNAKLQSAIDKAIVFYQALNPTNNPLGLTAASIDAIIRKLEVVKASSQAWGTILDINSQQIAQAFSSTVTAAFDKFAQAIAQGKNAFGALKDAFLDFASNFLKQIAQMILQQATFNLISGLLKGLAGGGAGVPTVTMHSGGIAGRDHTGTRSTQPAWFAAAARYHTGGIAGLAPNEVPIIAQKGEEILTDTDPRHRNNFGKGGSSGNSAAKNLKVVNVFDSAQVLEQALSTKAGEQVILNHIQNNSQAFNAALGR